MRDIEKEFNEYVQGSDVLYWWMKDIERDFNSGKRINKTKYNKIKKLEKEQRQKAIELLEIINRDRHVKICMPTRVTPPINYIIQVHDVAIVDLDKKED